MAAPLASSHAAGSASSSTQPALETAGSAEPAPGGLMAKIREALAHLAASGLGGGECSMQRPPRASGMPSQVCLVSKQATSGQEGAVS